MFIEAVRNNFKERFKGEPTIVKSPGRINIIGEHTDYNDGLVMPAAIDRGVYVAVATNGSREIRLFSDSYHQFHVADLNYIIKSEKKWANYILGVAYQITKSGYDISGFDLYIEGDVPLGAGLSSSAAVECSTAYALNILFQLGIPDMELAFIAQRAEHSFAGVNCGIMDQFASIFGKKDEVIMLDCRSMQYEYLPLQTGNYKLVLFNTNVKHSLASSAYNTRRIQCEQGVKWIGEHLEGISSLRDADLAMLEEYVKPKSLDVYKKCKYVVEENLRVAGAAEEMKKGNLPGLGELMFRTHKGLSKDYEVSCTELDFLVCAAWKSDNVLGSRMMGGGFGGCTLNLIHKDFIEELTSGIGFDYEKKFSRKMDSYLVEIGNGTQLVHD